MNWLSSRDGLVVSVFIFSILICLVASISTMVVVTIAKLSSKYTEELVEEDLEEEKKEV